MRWRARDINKNGNLNVKSGFYVREWSYVPTSRRYKARQLTAKSDGTERGSFLGKRGKRVWVEVRARGELDAGAPDGYKVGVGVDRFAAT